MKEKIEQLAKEKFEYQMPGLCIEPEKLEIKIQAQEIYRGNIRLTNRADRRMKGVVFTDNLLLTLEREQFVGEEANIPFVFCAKHLKAGEHFSGKIVFVTDAGEEILPYEVQINPPVLKAAEESIRDLFQFTSLAKADWAAAEALFFSEEFADAIFYHDTRYKVLYKVLAATGKKGQAMEEFLVATGKKPAIDLYFEKTELLYQAGDYDFKDSLILHKNGWGYVEGEISCDSPLIEFEKDHFCESDFVNGTLSIEFVVAAAKAAPGKHSALIRILTGKQERNVRLICAVEHKRGEQHRQRQSAKKALCSLLRIYLPLHCLGGNLRHTEQLKEQLILLSSIPQAERAAKLTQIYFWQLTGKDGAAREAISFLKAEEFLDEDRLLGFWYYLLAMQKAGSPDKELLSKEDAAGKIRDLCRKHQKDAALFFLLLSLDIKYQDRSARFEAIREFCTEYGFSALLLAEAAHLLHEDLLLLRELGEFELHILKTMLSSGCANGELIRRMTYLAAREKEIFPLLYQVLRKACKNKKDDELLSVICTLFIRSGRGEERDYPWIERAVEHQLKLAGLEEYYMKCRGERELSPIPSSIFQYFSHGCKLENRKKAQLYANLIQNRKEHSQIYPRYRRSMEAFAAEQIKCGAISPALAVIYNEIYRKQMEEESLLALPKVAFVHRVSSEFMRVLVYHPGQKEAVCVPIVHGEAQISIATSDAEVFLEDEQGRLYPAANLKGEKEGDRKAEITPLTSLGKHLWECYENGAADLLLLLYLKEEERKYLKYGSQPQELSRLLAENENVTQEYRQDCIHFLMEYYYENYEGNLFEYYLKRVDLEIFSKKERVRVIHFFIQRGFDESAVQALKIFGMEEIEVKRLSKLALRYLEAMEEEKADRFLLCLTYYIFECGRCERELLAYLCRFYHGATEAMYAIWKSARAQELDTEYLEESLLGQMLFAQSQVGNAQGVFLSYYRYGTNRKLIRAFLNFYAYRFLLNDRVISEELFELMEREVSLENNEICTLALLKHYAQEETFTQRQKDFLEHELSWVLKRGILLPFFKKFQDFAKFPEELYDKTFVEYHADPSHRVRLHYRIGDAGQFSECEMKNICHGIFTAGFVLFHEESMQYYITEEFDGQTLITQSVEAMSADEVAHDGKNRYDILNLILAAYAMKDDATVVKLLENYIRTEYEAEHLFHII